MLHIKCYHCNLCIRWSLRFAFLEFKMHSVFSMPFLLRLMLRMNTFTRLSRSDYQLPSPNAKNVFIRDRSLMPPLEGFDSVFWICIKTVGKWMLSQTFMRSFPQNDLTYTYSKPRITELYKYICVYIFQKYICIF